jgi:hypothetical protein
MRALVIAFMALSAVSVASSDCAALVIDTTTTDIGDNTPFGAPDTATYGQTFTVSGSETFLDSFSLFLRNRRFGSGTLDLRGYIATWTGTRAGTILFESGTETMNAAGALQEFPFDPDLVLVTGVEYVALLSISNLSAQSDSSFDMPNAGDRIAGEFVFINSGTDFGQLTSTDWTEVAPDDVWFRASLNAPTGIPAPPTLFLLGAGLLAMALLRPSYVGGCLRDRSIRSLE